MLARSARHEERYVRFVLADNVLRRKAEFGGDRGADIVDLIAEETHGRVGHDAVTANQYDGRRRLDVEGDRNWIAPDPRSRPGK